MSAWSRSRKRGVFKCLPLLPERTVSCGHLQQKGHVHRSKQIKLSHSVGGGAVCLFPISTLVLFYDVVQPAGTFSETEELKDKQLFRQRNQRRSFRRPEAELAENRWLQSEVQLSQNQTIDLLWLSFTVIGECFEFIIEKSILSMPLCH